MGRLSSTLASATGRFVMGMASGVRSSRSLVHFISGTCAGVHLTVMWGTCGEPRPADVFDVINDIVVPGYQKSTAASPSRKSNSTGKRSRGRAIYHPPVAVAISVQVRYHFGFVLCARMQMSKGIADTVCNGLDLAWGIQTKAFLPPLTSYFIANHVKACLAYEAETKKREKRYVESSDMSEDEAYIAFDQAACRKMELSRRTKKILLLLSSEGRTHYEVRVFDDPKRGQRVRLCWKHQRVSRSKEQMDEPQVCCSSSAVSVPLSFQRQPGPLREDPLYRLLLDDGSSVRKSLDEASFQSLPEAVTEATRLEEAAQAE